MSANTNSVAVSPSPETAAADVPCELSENGNAQQFKVGGWVSFKMTSKKNTVKYFKGTTSIDLSVYILNIADLHTILYILGRISLVLAVGRKGEKFTYTAQCEESTEDMDVGENDLVIKFLVKKDKYYIFPALDQIFPVLKEDVVCIDIPSIDARDHYYF